MYIEYIYILLPYIAVADVKKLYYNNLNSDWFALF